MTEKIPNKLTALAGLTFNVNSMKTKAIKPFLQRSIKKNERIPVLKKGHVVLTSLVEEMCKIIILEAKTKHAAKDKTGLCNIQRPTLKYAVQLNQDLDNFFHMFLLYKYDPEQDYLTTFPFHISEVEKLIDKISGKDVNVTIEAKHMLCFLLMKTYTECLRVLCTLLRFSKKNTFDVRALQAVVNILFGDTKLAEDLLKEIDNTWRAIEDKKDDDDDDEDEEDKEDDEEDKEEDKEDEEDEEDEEDKNDDDEDNEEETKKKVIKINNLDKKKSKKHLLN